jgi:N-formylglutamate amidohydrolase
MRPPFERIDPTGPETPVVVEVPHAGLEIPPQFLEPLMAPARSIARDADLYVDRLYDMAPSTGATLLVARTSRYAIDVNRSEADVDGEVVEGARAEPRMHHGLVWRTTSDGEAALSRRLTRDELEERLELVWRPYHRELTAIVSQKVASFGLAVVVAAHSMPSIERIGGQGPSMRDTRGGGAGARRRADVVPGTRGRRSAAPRFIEAMEAHARDQGWSVRHDDPYAGGFTTQHYGRPEDRVHVVQIELARRLYLDEATLRPLPTFDAVREWCRTLIVRLATVAAEDGPLSEGTRKQLEQGAARERGLTRG